MNIDCPFIELLDLNDDSRWAHDTPSPPPLASTQQSVYRNDYLNGDDFTDDDDYDSEDEEKILSRKEKSKHKTPRILGFRRQRVRWALYAILTLLSIYYIINLVPKRKPIHAPSIQYKNIDWRMYAYSLYATSSAYLCNAIMVFEALDRLGSKADRVLFYPSTWSLDPKGTTSDTAKRDIQLLLKAQSTYKVHLVPVNIDKVAPQGKHTIGRADWEASFMKFSAWSLTQYARVVQLDSDITLRKHLDELFLLPPSPVAMTRAYWTLPHSNVLLTEDTANSSSSSTASPSDRFRLTSLLIVLEPSDSEYTRLLTSARIDHRPSGAFDMEILNTLYADIALILPHRTYALLTGEFRHSPHDHSNFLGSASEPFLAPQILSDASLVHFSDWPLPKPWIMWPHNLIGEVMPRCRYLESGMVDGCEEKEIWQGLYDDFRRRRKGVCGLLSEVAPEWPPRTSPQGESKAEVSPKGEPRDVKSVSEAESEHESNQEVGQDA